ncbi:MAG: S8 family serine peptidase, partial [Planctomycetaceae bacterium]
DGIDNDGNGYIDDVHGYDFFADDGDPMDEEGHGTHVAGTIGAVGDNGVGVTGVAWKVQLMALRFLGPSGGTDADAIAAIEYAIAQGASIINNSWGGSSEGRALEDAIAAAGAAGQLFVVAAGNAGQDVDVIPDFPTSYTGDNILSVAATGTSDELAGFSNFGAKSVDIGAPGVDIYSTVLTASGSYASQSGTSMAAPHASGAAALLKASDPTLTYADIKALLMNSADPVPELRGVTVSGGRLNAFAGLTAGISVEPDSIGFGDVLAGSTRLLDLMVSNSSTSTINVSDISVAAPFSVSQATATLGPGQTEVVEVTFAPVVLGPFAETLTITSDDANTPTIHVPVTGTGAEPPDISVSPTAISQTLGVGVEVTEQLFVANAGPGDLHYQVVAMPATSSLSPAAINQTLSLAKGAKDPRAGSVEAAGISGPDPFGYRWIDSSELGGPVFRWEEITATGTEILPVGDGDDESLGPFAIEFQFPFYGATFDSFNLSTNGFISFTSGSTEFTNHPLPAPGAPENLIAALWDDLVFDQNTQAFYESDGSRLIVQYQGVRRWPDSGTYTFQIILEADGAIRLQYLSVAGVNDSATIGMQNSSGTIGLQIAFNRPFARDGLAVAIEPPTVPWLRVSGDGTTNTVAPGEEDTVDVTISTFHLADTAGLHTGLLVLSDDLDTPQILVP